MQKAFENSTIGAVLRLLYQPVPYLPEHSFLSSGRVEQRKRRALARIRVKAPQERKLRGNIETLSKGKCRICGHTVEINEATWIFGDIKDGAVAEMTLLDTGGSYVAKRVVII